MSSLNNDFQYNNFEILEYQSWALDENESEQQTWLRVYMEPWCEVIEKWKKTVNIRADQIQRSGNHIVHLLTKWPKYTHADGSQLVKKSFTLL